MTAHVEWPGDAETVIRWVRESLQPTDAKLVHGLEKLRIGAEVSGSDLESLTIDASGVELTLEPPASTEASTVLPAPVEEPTVVHRAAGVLRTVRVMADPVRIEGVAVSIDVQLYDVPVEWLVYDRPLDAGQPDTIRGLDLADQGTGMRGAVTVSLAATDLEPLLTTVARSILESEGAHLRRLKIAVSQDGVDGLRIDAKAGLRWRLLGASARGTARVGVAPGGIITLRDLRVGSGNPLVSIALRAARRSIREQIGKSIDLNDEFATDGGVRFTDVRVIAAERLTLSARLA